MGETSSILTKTETYWVKLRFTAWLGYFSSGWLSGSSTNKFNQRGLMISHWIVGFYKIQFGWDKVMV